MANGQKKKYNNSIILLLIIFSTLYPFNTSKLSSNEDKLLTLIKNYFTKTKCINVLFLQTNSDGTNATGKIYIEKPRTIKIQYFSPNQDSFILNDKLRLEYFDSELNEVTEIPLPRVFDIILFDDFSNIKIKKITETPFSIELLTAFEDSFVLFTFHKHPIKLDSWVIINKHKKISIKLKYKN